MITTSTDTAANTAVDSGFIGIGSYVNASCPYGYTWDNTAKSCSSCGTEVCGDFETCFKCVGCSEGQAIQQSSSFRNLVQDFWDSVQDSYKSSGDDLSSLGMTSLSYYSCSNSSSLCPAGSGKRDGDSGGCLICPADQFNDGSSGFCHHCPSTLYPSYQTRNRALYRGATACSLQCPEGTAALKPLTYQAISGGKRYEQSVSDLTLLGKHSVRLGVNWMNSMPFIDQKGKRHGQACFPCSLWQIIKDNTCQSCGAGATDRAALNSLGNSFSFATQCVPDICPWPYVVAGEGLLNEISVSDFGPREFPASAPPERSAAVRGVCDVNVHLGGTNATIAVIATFLFGSYMLALYFAAVGDDEALTRVRRRRLICGMLLSTVSPCIDFVSDLMYVFLASPSEPYFSVI
jgi:hypothetical protein